MVKARIKQELGLWGILIVCVVIIAVATAGFSFLPRLFLQAAERKVASNESASLATVQKWKNVLIARRQNEKVHLPILLYHYVENVTDLRDTIRQSLNISPKVFEAQIATLLTNNYTPIKLDDLVNYYNGGPALPAKPVIFSFDDGYRDFYTDVFPILQKYRVPAVLYMVSGYRDTTKNYLTTAQLLALGQSSFVEIAAHSVHHPALTGLPLESARKEILESKLELEGLFGRKIDHFAYPYGHFNTSIVQMVEEAGYLTAVGVQEGTLQEYQNRFTLKRIRPGNLIGKALIYRITNSQ